MKHLCFGVAFASALCNVVSAQPITSTRPTPSPVASSPPGLDPFCPVEVRAAPIAGSSNLVALGLISQSGPSVDAHVIFLSDTDAYDVVLRNVSVAGSNYRYESQMFVVELPKPASIHVAYVDSYTVVGGTEQSCPSEPIDVSRAKPEGSPPPQIPRVAATLKEALPALPCGKIFTFATVTKATRPVFPAAAHLDRTGTSEVEIFIDSDGNPIKTYVRKTLGQAFDDAAIQAALRSKFAPATLLCTPVVGKYMWRADFVP